MDIKDLIVVQEKGVYYIYINAEFLCSCDNFTEVREEIDNYAKTKQG